MDSSAIGGGMAADLAAWVRRRGRQGGSPELRPLLTARFEAEVQCPAEPDDTSVLPRPAPDTSGHLSGAMERDATAAEAKRAVPHLSLVGVHVGPFVCRHVVGLRLPVAIDGLAAGLANVFA